MSENRFDEMGWLEVFWDGYLKAVREGRSETEAIAAGRLRANIATYDRLTSVSGS